MNPTPDDRLPRSPAEGHGDADDGGGHPPEGAGARPDRDEPYTIDHLVADQRRQTRFLLALFLLAILYVTGRAFLDGGASPGPGDSPAPRRSLETDPGGSQPEPPR